MHREPRTGVNVGVRNLEGSAISVWRDRAKIASEKGRYRRGVGAACAAWFAFAEPKTRIEIRAGKDGVVASLSSQDMGNGTRTVIAEAVADELGIPRSKVQVELGDSRLVPACIDACAQLHDELVEVAERHFGLKHAKVGKGGVSHAGGVMPWRDVLAVAKPITVVGRRRKDQGGWFLPPIQGLAIEKYVSGAIQIVEVEVDTRLGRVRPVEVWAASCKGSGTRCTRNVGSIRDRATCSPPASRTTASQASAMRRRCTCTSRSAATSACRAER